MKIASIKFFLISYFLILLSPNALAEGEEKFSVKAEVDKASLTIGERVEYRVTITHDPSIQVLSKVVPAPSDAFEVKEAHDFYEKHGKEIAEGRRFVLTLYDLGEFILEPVTVQYRTAGGEERSTETNRLYLSVQSVDTSGKPKADIRDVKTVMKLRGGWGWIFTLLAVLVLVVGGGIAWWRWRNRSLEGEQPEGPPISPEDEALIRLNRLFDSDLIRRGKLKEYFLELSEILRQYLERRFEILAVESTTSEIIRSLTSREISPSLLNKIQQVMESADFVKFAKWKPEPSEIVRINQMSKAFIEEARPKMYLPETVTPQAEHGI